MFSLSSREDMLFGKKSLFSYERKGEKHRYERDASVGCLPHMRPGMVCDRTGSSTHNRSVTRQCSSQPSHSGRGSFLKTCYLEITCRFPCNGKKGQREPRYPSSSGNMLQNCNASQPEKGCRYDPLAFFSYHQAYLYPNVCLCACVCVCSSVHIDLL